MHWNICFVYTWIPIFNRILSRMFLIITTSVKYHYLTAHYYSDRVHSRRPCPWPHSQDLHLHLHLPSDTRLAFPWMSPLEWVQTHRMRWCHSGWRTLWLQACSLHEDCSRLRSHRVQQGHSTWNSPLWWGPIGRRQNRMHYDHCHRWIGESRRQKYMRCIHYDHYL